MVAVVLAAAFSVVNGVHDAGTAIAAPNSKGALPVAPDSALGTAFLPGRPSIMASATQYGSVPSGSSMSATATTSAARTEARQHRLTPQDEIFGLGT